MDSVYRAALALGTANQLTNILRDVGEDARERNRIYLPMDELARFGITEQEVSSPEPSAHMKNLACSARQAHISVVATRRHGSLCMVTVSVLGFANSACAPLCSILHAASFGMLGNKQRYVRANHQMLCGCCCADLQVLTGLHVPSQGKVDERWRQFMKFQIQRARDLFKEAEEGVDNLEAKARWPVW